MEVALKCTQELTAFCWSGSSFDVLERQHARQMAPGSWLLCLWYFREASMLRIATEGVRWFVCEGFPSHQGDEPE